MPYEPFFERFGELAWKETRSLRFFKDPWLADDEFGFIELYCNDENCDCRRVMFDVLSKNQQKSVAVIAYGWESREFYARWYREEDPEIIEQMQGPILNPSSHQSELAPVLLEKVRDMLLTDPEYIARLKQHYRIFKEKVDPKHFRATNLLESEMRTLSQKRKRKRKRSK